MNDTFGQLRAYLDGDEAFMTGHRIAKIRRNKRKIPEWTRTDEGIQKVILRSFPDQDINLKQREKAGRWARIIHLYFRLGLSETEISEEMDMKIHSVKAMLVGIKRVAQGRRYDNRGMLKRKK